MHSILRSNFRRAAALCLLLSVAACGDSSPYAPTEPSNPANDTFAASLGVNITQMTRMTDDLYVKDVVVGTGTEATNGRLLNVVYTGWLPNGTKFDSNVGGLLLKFVLGQREVIDGWDKGIAGMRAGGKRRLVIGSNLGYGPSGRGSIPPNTTMVFDVELVAVQ